MVKTIIDRSRWLALLVLCLGDLMIVLDSTIVNVALPSIRDDLGFSEVSLAWVVNAYLLTFGGFLLLGGRLGDILGHRKMFIAGTALFTLASVACGLANSQELLIAARALQGIGGAIVSAVALSLIINLFTKPAERAKAMGVFGFVLSGGGVAGVLLGGFLTGALNWHWIFLVNIPIGITVILLALSFVPSVKSTSKTKHIDIAGAATVTVSLVLAVYAIVNGNAVGWTSGQTIGLLSIAVVLLAVFLVIESKVRSPLMPLSIFRASGVGVANGVGVLMAGGMFAWFFFSALYLQQILGYSAFQVGFAYLPSMLIWGAASFFLSGRLVIRFGIKKPLLTGLTLMTVGLLLFSLAPVGGDFILHVLPGSIAVGLGAAIAFNPLLLAAMSSVKPSESGLASGVVNTAFMMGGALALAVLASLAASRTVGLLASGDAQLAAINGGYQTAFLVGAIFTAVATIVGAVFLRRDSQDPKQKSAQH